MRTAALALGVMITFALGAARPAPASADEPVMIDVEGAFLAPVTAPQTDRFQPGAALSVAALFAPLPYIVPALRLRGGFLGDGARPQDATLRDPGVGDLFTLTAGVRIRPQGFLDPSDVARGTSFWLELDIGGALTGGVTRPVFEIGLGYVFDVGDVGVGPALRLIHVMQTEEGLDARSAYLVTAGLEIILRDRRAPQPLASAVEPSDGVETLTRDQDEDRDGIAEERDLCPEDREDRDGFEDEDGCPDGDDDQDRLPDSTDQCPREAEDRDRWQDGDGCPDPDNDGDGFVDTNDGCPFQAETMNGLEDADGCPDVGLVEEPVESAAPEGETP